MFSPIHSYSLSQPASVVSYGWGIQHYRMAQLHNQFSWLWNTSHTQQGMPVTHGISFYKCSKLIYFDGIISMNLRILQRDHGLGPTVCYMFFFPVPIIKFLAFLQVRSNVLQTCLIPDSVNMFHLFHVKGFPIHSTLTLPSPYVGMGGSLTVTVA